MKYFFILLISFSFLNFDCNEITPVLDDICDITAEICLYANEICSLTNGKEITSQIDVNLLAEISNNKTDIKRLYEIINSKEIVLSSDELSDLKQKLHLIRTSLKEKLSELKSK